MKIWLYWSGLHILVPLRLLTLELRRGFATLLHISADVLDELGDWIDA